MSLCPVVPSEQREAQQIQRRTDPVIGRGNATEAVGGVHEADARPAGIGLYRFSSGRLCCVCLHRKCAWSGCSSAIHGEFVEPSATLSYNYLILFSLAHRPLLPFFLPTRGLCNRRRALLLYLIPGRNRMSFSIDKGFSLLCVLLLWLRLARRLRWYKLLLCTYPV